MKILIFMLLICGLNIIGYSQAFRDTAEIHFIKNILKNPRVKNWEEHLRYKNFLEMKNELHKEDSLYNIRKNKHNGIDYNFWFYHNQLIKPVFPTILIFPDEDMYTYYG